MEHNQPTRLNSMQQYMLHLFDRELSPQQETEIRLLLSNYFAKLVDDEMDRIVAEQGITADQLEKEASVHRRTPYHLKR
ncbi:hypothetical protein [Spirosoma aerolatum]|uniref:hypothetical protein n=1 Tax=Spirosoma aerolatum TaxID=1211326 RepID=UPI0009AEC6CB|nr:hypothetical protein [Spirosoma aerolatum]